MLKISTIAWAALALFSAATPASATLLFDNPPDVDNGSCVFNTTCGPINTGDTYAGQAFTLATGATITDGSFTVYTNNASQPSSVNWRIHAGGGALPGALLFNGNSTIGLRQVVGSFRDFDVRRENFALPSIALGAGSYFLALQAVSTDFRVFLAFANGSGAVQSDDGGLTYGLNYHTANAVAVSLSDNSAVPEPASWALMIGGFGLAGGALRRRKALAA